MATAGEKIKVLFLCIHNSARSQMAEAYLEKFGGDRFIAESAGLEAGILNPLAVKVMLEDGIDISGNKTKDVNDFVKEGRSYRYVVTVCDEANAARCPFFPGVHRKMSWNLADPSTLEGAPEEKLQRTREIRNQVKSAVLNFIKEIKGT